jgi:hypothetical protein
MSFPRLPQRGRVYNMELRGTDKCVYHYQFFHIKLSEFSVCLFVIILLLNIEIEKLKCTI